MAAMPENETDGSWSSTTTPRSAASRRHAETRRPSGDDGGQRPRRLDALRGGTTELVLLDIGLPFVSGWQILETLEQRRRPT
jgi:DNA-binding response OmpR family regulator